MIANDTQHFPLHSNFRQWNSLTWIKPIQVNEKSTSVFIYCSKTFLNYTYLFTSYTSINHLCFADILWIQVCRIGIYGYGYIYGYARKICGYGYGCKISYTRQAWFFRCMILPPVKFRPGDPKGLIGVKNRGQISHFFNPVKLGEGGENCLRAIFYNTYGPNLWHGSTGELGDLMSGKKTSTAKNKACVQHGS